MNFLRWFLGFVLFLLTFLAWQESRSVDSKQVIQPKLERSTMEGRDFVYYTVQGGDTLDSVARKFRIPDSEAILSLNPGMNRDQLPVNHQIRIPLR